MPEDFDAMHELLKYGLRGTDVEAMVALGNRTDNGRSVALIILSSSIFAVFEETNFVGFFFGFVFTSFLIFRSVHGFMLHKLCEATSNSEQSIVSQKECQV